MDDKQAGRWARFKKLWRKAGVVLLSCILLFFIIDLIAPLKTDVPYAQVVTTADGTVLHAWLARDKQWRMQTRLEEITPELKKAILFKEDKHFYHHVGINPLAVCRAVYDNIMHLKRTSGASTISMQVVRMLEPKPRTYFNKIIEMFRALQLEVHCSKDQILQLYLNLVPYGSNIQGVKAASLLYFNKTPDQLSLAEITALSVIPNKPNSLVVGRNNPKIVDERNKWLARFDSAGLFPKNIIRDAENEPLTAYRHKAPDGAPQFAWRMRWAYPGSPIVHTTLDGKMQQNAETIVGNYLNELRQRGVNNASVLVIDNKTHEVVSYIGSADFTDKAHFGQVDGVRALRSPGSTLKPLLYALAFDQGLVTPKYVVADVPINIKGYTPENYDKQFRGNVTIEYALRNSLNIPAVKTLDEVGVHNFLNVLTKIGFKSTDQKKKDLGLSLILGGCGVRLQELTNLFSAFANEGMYYPVRYLAQEKTDAKKIAATGKLDSAYQVISPAADYMLTQILCELQRPDLPNAYNMAQGLPKVAWKTGTSYGRRDAWSIGYNKRYTIGVWLGNFSGVGVPDLSGANTATPLLFRLFNALDHNATNEWLEAPASLSFRLVCAETGKPPGGFCQNQVMDYYLPGVSKTEACNHMKEFWLSTDEKYCYCTSCLPPNGYKTKTLPNISAELAAYNDSRHIPYFKLPPHNPACTRLFSGQPPAITSLTNGMTYLIADKEQQKLQLSCATGSDVRKVFWYINDKFYASGGASEHLFFSATGTDIKISCTDDKGRTTSIAIKVKFI